MANVLLLTVKFASAGKNNLKLYILIIRFKIIDGLKKISYCNLYKDVVQSC